MTSITVDTVLLVLDVPTIVPSTRSTPFAKTPSPRFSSMQSSVATVLTAEAGSSRYSSMKNAQDTGWRAPGWLEFPTHVT